MNRTSLLSMLYGGIFGALLSQRNTPVTSLPWIYWVGLALMLLASCLSLIAEYRKPPTSINMRTQRIARSINLLVIGLGALTVLGLVAFMLTASLRPIQLDIFGWNNRYWTGGTLAWTVSGLIMVGLGTWNLFYRLLPPAQNGKRS